MRIPDSELQLYHFSLPIRNPDPEIRNPTVLSLAALMYRAFRPILFRQDPEAIHYRAMRWLQRACRVPAMRSLLRRQYTILDSRLERTVFGITFSNPVGLAAGFDKDARWTDELSTLGFGFIEIGTLTPEPQPGNEPPRLFRLPADRALINRMGFNNGGAKAAAERLNRRKERLIIGGNIGKNKATPNEDALSDYIKAYEALKEVVDYFVVNVSSPNTPGLRALQEKRPLLEILNALQDLNRQSGKPKPFLLKIAPDLTDEQLDDIADIIKESGIAGVIATNTTISRANLSTAKEKTDDIGAGGLSGKPLLARSTEVVRYLHQKSGGAFPIIASGGIFTAEDALEKIEAGASLVQVYTGFIYEGPAIAKNICKGLLQKMNNKK